MYGELVIRYPDVYLPRFGDDDVTTTPPGIWTVVATADFTLLTDVAMTSLVEVASTTALERVPPTEWLDRPATLVGTLPTSVVLNVAPLTWARSDEHLLAIPLDVLTQFPDGALEPLARPLQEQLIDLHGVGLELDLLLGLATDITIVTPR